ncbi:TetR/AcrR family transcriptional regulator [Nocardia altamirensis]|uniref:TetR/AcrR family transcriptional regulator n=1 Tax=Nocardia altamirensis TaxID=472158 RepID=UPI0008403CD5|nr:TetR/AcrR family transcriptional regulator [Nocardia altamirensis]
MPKLVDHDMRRRAITAAVWRLIAARGIDRVTMRDIATEAGFANGSLSHYFSGKDDILRLAFQHVFEATNIRIAARLGRATGLAAIRVFCREVLPITDETLLEARIATSLWQRAMYDAQMYDINARAMREWRALLTEFFGQARQAGDIGAIDVGTVVEQLLNMMMGAQILGVLTPDITTARRQLDMLESFLDALPHPA